MNEEPGKFIHKALQSIDAAKSLLDGGYSDFAGARAYYAMFYTAEALMSLRLRHFVLAEGLGEVVDDVERGHRPSP